MNLGDFEKYVSKKGMKIVERQEINDLKVLFCEGRSSPDRDCPHFHWKVMYAIFEGEEAFIAEDFQVSFGEKTTHEDRIANARFRAEEWIRNFYENGQRRKIN